jgi:hypothetical protein
LPPTSVPGSWAANNPHFHLAIDNFHVRPMQVKLA